MRPSSSRVGIVTFSYNSELSIKYNDYHIKSDLTKAIEDLPLFGYTTRIDKGLKLAKEQLILKSIEERPNVPKILILLTDGTQTKDSDAIDPAEIAEEIRNMGVQLLVIGIGNSINSTELTSIAGDKLMFMWQVISKNLYLKDLYDLCHKEYVKVRGNLFYY